ncbi:ABC transporter permease [Candidatus Geothermarchaeota archaeon]|nr:MAG: ABC transporter permease [Candidatus Geothermarchaeota archaeon]
MNRVADRFSRVLKPLAEEVIAVIAGLLVGALFITVCGYDPIEAYIAMFQGAFGGVHQLAETLAAATPILLTGLTFAICVKVGLFNIGAEGQAYIGAVAAVLIGAQSFPYGVHLLAAVFVAMLAGALWSIPPALLKISRGVHEVVSTIMLNWIAFYLVYYLARGPLVDASRPEKTVSVSPTSRFPILIEGTTLTAVLFIGVLFAVALYIVLWHTPLGYEMRSLGLNPNASKFAGVSYNKAVLSAFVLGGFTAGLAGAVQILGRPPTYALYGDLSNIVNIGFDGLAVAMIGRNHPLGMILSSIFFGGLYTGARWMQILAGVPLELVRIIEGIIVIATAIPEIIYMIKRLGARRIA